MIFKSIILENFRPYYGRVNFEFCSGEKNITLLKAENGSGKTTLLEAIKWGLYGDNLNLTAGNPKQFGASSFVNKKYLSENKGKVSAKVILTIVGKVSEEAVEEEYTIIREIVFENDAFIATNLTLKTKTGEINNSQEIIDKLLPKEIDFFVDGERLEKIAPEKDNVRKIKNERVEVLKESINRVLGIKSLENAVSDVAKIHKEFEKEYLESSKSEKNIVELTKKIDEFRTKEKEKKYQKEEKEKEVEVLKERREKFNEKYEEILTQSQEDEKIKIKIDSFQKKKLELEKKENLILNRYKKLLSIKGVEIISDTILNNAFKIVEEKKNKGEIPSRYEKEFLEELLELKTCICGASLEKDTENYIKIKEKLEKAASKESREKISEIFFILKNRDKKKRLLDINQIKKELVEIKQNKAEAEEELEKLLQKSNYDLQVEFQNIKSQIKEIESKENILHKQIGSIELELENIKKELNSLAISKQEADKKNEKSKRERLKRDFAYKILLDFETLKKHKETQGRDGLKKKIEEVYSQINKKGYQVELTEDFTFKIYDSDGKEAGTSKGEAKNKALSFIGGLIYYAKELNKQNNNSEIESDGGIYPLVLDAPYGDLDNEYRLDFTKMLPVLSEQIIVMVSSGQWNSKIEEVVKNKIGKKYILENERRTGNEKKFDITRVREEF